jgi:hypothetical protein
LLVTYKIKMEVGGFEKLKKSKTFFGTLLESLTDDVHAVFLF